MVLAPFPESLVLNSDHMWELPRTNLKKMQPSGPTLDKKHGPAAGILRGLELSGHYIWLPGKVRGAEFRLRKKYFNYLTLIVAFCFSFRNVPNTGECCFLFSTLLHLINFTVCCALKCSQLCFIHVTNVCHASNMNEGTILSFCVTSLVFRKRCV